MIKFENVEIAGWRPAIRGMRNPKNSWEKSDSGVCATHGPDHCADCVYTDCHADDVEIGTKYILGPNDHDLTTRLSNAGTDHRKFMRMVAVYVDITAPLYWWKEFDTYKVGTVSNSCSTMHKIADKEFILDDFSHEHLLNMYNNAHGDALFLNGAPNIRVDGNDLLCLTINVLNYYRKRYIETKNKRYWWQMIQLLPSSYNQKRTIMLNYEVLANIYKSRKNHKLDEWREFCAWIKSLPYSELVTHVVQKEDIQSNPIEDLETINLYGQRILKKDIQNSDSYSDAKFNGGL